MYPGRLSPCLTNTRAISWQGFVYALFLHIGSWAHWREQWLFVSNVLACVSWYAKLLWIAVGCTTYLTHVCRQDMCIYDWNSVWAMSADPPARSLPGEMWRGDHVALPLRVGICVKDRTFFL